MKKLITILLMLAIIVASTHAISAKLYRWKDANGEIYFSDKVPPSDAKKERTTLNESGRAISIKDAQKNPQEIAQLKKINALKKAQKVSLKKQLAEDSALLKTFQSTDDIESLTKGKLEMLDSQVKIISSQSTTLKNQLINYQKNAANYERSGKKISKKTISNITSAQNQYDKNLSEIVELKQKQTTLLKQLESDKTRFKLLEKKPINEPFVYSSGTPSLALGTLICKEGSCPTLWSKAKIFIETRADTRITFESNTLVLTSSPKQSSDKTLTLFAQENSKVTVITLDIRCENNIKGRNICKDQEAHQLAEAFNNLKNQ
jgi:hypothetical protein